MKRKAINILEFPSNLGLKKKPHETEPGVNKLPEHLKKFGFYDMVDPDRILRCDPPPYTMDLDRDTGVRNLDKIVEYAIAQSNLLFAELDQDIFQLMIGGDCSILIGNALAQKRLGRSGLFFLDGHTDFVLPELSGTGGVAGMDLAIATGHGPEQLTNIQGLGPYIEENHVFCVGNRYFEPEYVRYISQSDIHYFDLNRLREYGPGEIAQDFIEMVQKEHLGRFLIHLDVDVLDDQLMPAVDSRSKDGLAYDELSAMLEPLLANELAYGIEITILDPELDQNGSYTRQFINALGPLIQAIR